MRNPLWKRLPREFLGDMGKYLIIFIFMTATIGFISGFLVADDSLIQAYDESFETYNIEDGNFELAWEAKDSLLEELEKTGVTVYPNYYTEEDAGGKNDGTLRIFSERKEVNKVCLMEGELPQKEDEIALDRMYADNNEIHTGDILEVGGKKLSVSGLVALSDYSALFSDNGDMMFDAVKFGVSIMTEKGLEGFGEKNLHYSYSWKYGKQPENETEEKEMSEDFLEELASRTVLLNYIPRYTNQAIQFTGDDMGSDKTLMMTLLYILIAILAFVFAVTTNHTISKEAAVIGTLRASGYTKRELLFHYISVPAAVTFAAALAGNILGYTVFKGICADMYYGSYSLPTYETRWNAEAFLMTTAVPFLIMLIINFLMIYSKLRLSPLKFLRRDLRRSRNQKAVRLPNFRFFHRFRIRIILQNKSGYFTLFAGIIFANLLFMYGMAMSPLLKNFQEETVKHMISEYQYILKTPVETESKNAEKYCADSVKTVSEDLESEPVSVYGIQRDSAYFTADFPENGVLLSDGYAEKYRIKEGDTVRVKESYGSREYEFQVAGFYDYPAMLSIFMPVEEYREIFEKEDDYFNGYFSGEELEDIDAVYVATVITEDDLTKLSRQLDVSMGNLFYMVNVFAVILSAILIYLLTKLIIEKNASAISMVKILGYENREISKLYVTATTWVVVLSMAASLFVDTWIISLIYRDMMKGFQGWLRLYMKPSIYPEIFAAGMVVYAAAAILQMRRIKRIPMEEALKNAE